MLNSNSVCPVLGLCRYLLPNVLATYEDTMLYYLWTCHDKTNIYIYKAPVSYSCVEVAEVVMILWKLFFLSIIDHRAVSKKK